MNLILHGGGSGSRRGGAGDTNRRLGGSQRVQEGEQVNDNISLKAIFRQRLLRQISNHTVPRYLSISTRWEGGGVFLEEACCAPATRKGGWAGHNVPRRGNKSMTIFRQRLYFASGYCNRFPTIHFHDAPRFTPGGGGGSDPRGGVFLHHSNRNRVL